MAFENALQQEEKNMLLTTGIVKNFNNFIVTAKDIQAESKHDKSSKKTTPWKIPFFFLTSLSKHYRRHCRLKETFHLSILSHEKV